MRPFGTWVVIGAVALIGLFAARDALRSDEAPASAPATTTLAKQRRPPPGRPPPAEKPRIVGRARLAADVRALGAEGVLYLTDANCRRFLLRLPSLQWTPQGLPGPVCPNATVVDERFGLEASQVDADVIEVRSEDWSLRFQGTAPAFRPEGRLTFIRAGRLFEWTVQCPPAAERVVFRGFRALARCPRLVPGAPDRLREVVWLDERDYAALIGQEYAPTLVVVRGGKARSVFQALGARMGGLEPSPGGRYVAVRIDGNLALFDTVTRRPVLLPPGADGPLNAIAWSDDDRYAVVASERALHVYSPAKPSRGVTIPVAAIGVDWR
jgi:hypothetical protein